MNYDKDECEKLIDSSILFSLDREKERTAYRREALRMVEYLYCYLMALNTYKYEAYGVEILDVAKRCVENYNPVSGRFLNYFMAAWKKSFGHIVGKELVKGNFGGIHFTEDEERNYRKCRRLVQSMGIDTESPEFDRKIAEAMGLSSDEAVSLHNMVNSRPISGSYINDEGEEYSLIDQIDSGSYTDEGVLQLETAREFIELIEITFCELQERQKPMISMLLTSKLSILVSDDEALMEFVKKKSFFDERVFYETVRRGEQIQARKIAEKFNVDEASTSRSWKNFKEKIKRNKQK